MSADLRQPADAAGAGSEPAPSRIPEPGADAPRTPGAASDPVGDPVGDPMGPDLDVERLERILGREARLFRLLRDFETSLRTDLEEIAQALATGDDERAKALTHRLKGTAGNLGAPVLRAAAAALEEAIRDGRPTEPALAGLRLARMRVLARIGELLPDESVSATAAAAGEGDGLGDPGAAAALAVRLGPMLDDMDLISDELLDELAAAVPAPHAALYHDFRHHVEMIDYRQARSALERLLQALGSPTDALG